LERPDANVGSQAFLTTLHPSIASQVSTIIPKVAGNHKIDYKQLCDSMKTMIA